MQNTVRENWKRRIRATTAVLVLMCFIAALWNYGRSFAKVLQIDSADVARIVITRQGDADAAYTDRAFIDSFMSYLNDFRYTAYYDRSNLSGCAVERYVTLFGHSGRELSRLSFSDEAVAVYRDDVYLGNTPYFEPLCQRLHL